MVAWLGASHTKQGDFMSFEHNFDEAKESIPETAEDEIKKLDKKYSVIKFLASIEGFRLLKDGGVTLTLGISSSDSKRIANDLLKINESNCLLQIYGKVIEPETFGGSKL